MKSLWLLAATEKFYLSAAESTGFLWFVKNMVTLFDRPHRPHHSPRRPVGHYHLLDSSVQLVIHLVNFQYSSDLSANVTKRLFLCIILLMGRSSSLEKSWL